MVRGVEPLPTLRLAALACAFAGAVTSAAAAAEPVDLELALAVDVSGSMSAAEAELQRQGYIDALTDREFLEAIGRGRSGRIAVSYIEWAGVDQQWLTVPWSVIDGEESAHDFVARIGPPRSVHWRGTSISAAIDFAIRSIEANDLAGERRAIDISGDGPNNSGPPLAAMRAMAVDRGITVNGLPVVSQDAGYFVGIDTYYADCVIAGPGAFSLPANGLSQFAAAIRLKLILEVAGYAPSRTAAPQPAAATDCAAAERLRRQFLDRYYPQL